MADNRWAAAHPEDWEYLEPPSLYDLWDMREKVLEEAPPPEIVNDLKGEKD